MWFSCLLDNLLRITKAYQDYEEQVLTKNV